MFWEPPFYLTPTLLIVSSQGLVSVGRELEGQGLKTLLLWCGCNLDLMSSKEWMPRCWLFSPKRHFVGLFVILHGCLSLVCYNKVPLMGNLKENI